MKNGLIIRKRKKYERWPFMDKELEKLLINHIQDDGKYKINVPKMYKNVPTNSNKIRQKQNKYETIRQNTKQSEQIRKNLKKTN